MDQERSKEIHSKILLIRYVGVLLLTLTSILLHLVTLSQKKTFVYDKCGFFSMMFAFGK